MFLMWAWGAGQHRSKTGCPVPASLKAAPTISLNHFINSNHRSRGCSGTWVQLDLTWKVTSVHSRVHQSLQVECGPCQPWCFWARLPRAPHQSLCKSGGNLKPREEQDSGWHSINPKNYDKPSAALNLFAFWNISGVGCLAFLIALLFPISPL